MSDLVKVKIWKTLNASNHFWMATLILYFTDRNLSTSQALELISLYSVLIVVLEYPTGVIGDYFSHRLSVALGTLSWAVSFALLALPGSFSYYLLAVGAAALSASLISGSDTALLHSVSDDFKKDLAQITPYALALSVINIAIGGFVASFDIKFPLYLSLLYSILSLPFVVFLRNYKYKRDEGNIFATALAGLRDIQTNKLLKNLIIISSVSGAFFISVKWFYNPLFQTLSIPVSLWGIIMSAAMFLIAIGAKIYQKYSDFKTLYVVIGIGFCLVLIGITNSTIIPILGIWISHVLRGYLDTQLGVEINSAITTGRRASILSFNSLLVRLGSAAYIAGAGYFLPKTSFLIIMLCTIVASGLLVVGPLSKLPKTK